MDDSSRVELFKYTGPRETNHLNDITKYYMSLNIEGMEIFAMMGEPDEYRMFIQITAPRDKVQYIAPKPPIEATKCNELHTIPKPSGPIFPKNTRRIKAMRDLIFKRWS